MRPAAPLGVAVAASFVVALVVGVAAAKPPAVIEATSDTTFFARADDRSLVLPARRVTFSRPVLQAVYEPKTHRVYAHCDLGGEVVEATASPTSIIADAMEYRGQSAVVCYDLETRRTLWTHDVDASIAAVTNGCVVLTTRRHTRLLDAADGRDRGDLPGGVAVDPDDGVALRAANGTLSRFDLATRKETWEHPFDHVHGDLETRRIGRRVWLAGEGVGCVDVDTGEGWDYGLKTNRSNRASAVIADILYFGATLQVAPDWGSRIDRLRSLPLVSGDRVYFAGDTTVVCLERHDGSEVWKRGLAPDDWMQAQIRVMGHLPAPPMPGLIQLADADTALVVVTCGSTSRAVAGRRPDPATVAILSKATGATLRRVRVPGMPEVFECRATPRGLALTGPDAIEILDRDLRLVARRPLAGVGTAAFTDVERPLVLRTGGTLMALSPDSLTVLWSRPLGGHIRVLRDGSAWWAGGATALARFPDAAAADSAVVDVPIAAGGIQFQSGAAVGVDSTSVTVISLPAAGR